MSLSVSKCTDETESVINPIEDDEDFSSDAIESKDAKSRLPRDLSFTCVETVDHIWYDGSFLHSGIFCNILYFSERFAAMPCIKDESEFEVDFCALDEGLDSVGAEVPPTEGSVDTMAESMAKSLTTTGIEEFVTSQLKKVAEQVACVSQSPNNGANLLCKVLPSEETRSQTSSIQAIPSFNPHSQRPSIAKGSPPGPRVTMKQVVSPMRRKFVVSKVPQSEETAVDCQFRRRAVSESATEAVLPSLDLSPMVESIECANELNNNVSKHSVVQFTATTSEKSMVEKTIFLPVSDEIEQLVRDMVAFCIYECGDSQTEKVSKGTDSPFLRLCFH